MLVETRGWEPGRDPWRSLCDHDDDVEDGLSECETVFACPDYDGDGSTFDDDIISQTGAAGRSIVRLVLL
jgi:hypothetical protein